MASKTLTAKVAINTTNAHRSLDKLIKKINQVNNFVNKNTNAKGLDKQLEKALLQQEKLKQATAKTQLAEAKVTAQNYKSNKAKSDASIAEERLIQAKHRTALAEQKVVTATERAKHSTNTLLSAAKKLAGTYLGIQTARLAITASDTVTRTQNRLNAMNGYDETATAESMDKIYAAAQRSRSGYDEMLNNVSKTMTLAPDAFQGNIDNAIRFQEIMAKSYTLGGATDAEKHSSMYQLTQALGAGVLAGDELRSVREGAPLAYQAIEKFAQKTLNCSESLKDMASDGKITSDLVVAAIMDMGNGVDNIDDKFAKTKVTFAEAWTQIKNTGMKALQPVLEKMNELLTSEKGANIINAVTSAIVMLSNALVWAFDVFAQFFDWCAANWSWLKYIILGVVIFLIIQFAILAWQAIVTGVTMFISWLAATWPLLLIIAIIVLIIAILAKLTGSVEKALGIIVGIIMAAVAFVWNLIVGVINGILQFLWTRFVEPFIGIIEWILNVCNGGFDSFGGAVANLIGQIISWFLSLGKVVTKIIDAIFGTNWTAGLSSLQDKVLSWGKNDTAITINREAPSLKNIGVDRWSYTDAYNTGYKWGSDAGAWLNGTFDTIANSTSLVNPNDSTYSVGGAYDTNNIGKNLGGIKDDTGKISDSMDLTTDELDYLRKIAEMEWRKEFTTAEIRVDMTNNNSITSERDWEGMLEYLSDTLKEEMNEVAYGVHY